MNQISQKAYDDFGKKVFRDIEKHNSRLWDRVRENTMLKTFRLAARSVPAYRDFLKRNKISAEKIRTFSDFQNVPPIDKKNYLNKYEIEKLVWPNSFSKTVVFTSTSGSTGKPTYFPREYSLDWQSSIAHELFLRQAVKKGPTLVIVGFGTGVWIAGLITYRAFEISGFRGRYPVSIITPGINKFEIMNALKKLSPHFAQTVLIGYPPFIKDVIDDAPNEGINLSELNLKVIFAAEAFTEKFRDHVAQAANLDNPHLDSMNIYGSADLGTMAFETPFGILIRRLATKKEKIFKNIFSQINKTPTLANYIPHFINFEAPRGQILVTGNNTIPLIRYAIGDMGGIYSSAEIRQKLLEDDVKLDDEIRASKIENFVYDLPFVYIYERADMATTLYGLQIYPEIIREAIFDSILNRYLTGKLTLITKFDRKHNQYLEINLEMKKDRKHNTALKNHATKTIVKHLQLKSSEFRELSRYVGKRAMPKVIFWPAEHPEHFKSEIKQKWVKHQ